MLPDEVEAQAGWRALVPRFEYLLDDLMTATSVSEVLGDLTR